MDGRALHLCHALVALLLCLAATGCAEDGGEPVAPTDAGEADGERCLPTRASADLLRSAAPVDPLSEGASDPRADTLVLYELQVRSANACHPDVGSTAQRAACAAKVAPVVTYRGEGPACPATTLDALEAIRLGTLDDLMRDTDDMREAISLRYLADRLGVNAVWLMPLFPNNDQWSLPAPCDNIGSPYAVRDYLHVRPSLAEDCILAEASGDAAPCWGNATFAAMIDEAKARGVRVFLDVAFNHFGHNYVLYDTAGATPLARQLADGATRETLWDFEATYDPTLVSPTVLDTPDALARAAAADPALATDLRALQATCPELTGDALVRAFGPWHLAFEDERRGWDCGALSLEWMLPGFYVAQDGRRPARSVDEMTSAYGWNDVKFLHHQDTPLGEREALRVREYLFRVMNYWVAQGVEGFRLDHATDGISGLSPETWRYILAKTAFYAEQRGQAPPIVLVEEFHDQQGMRDAADIMTEGFVFGMTGRDGVANASRVRRVLNDANRFDGRTRVMTALETHDEVRLSTAAGWDPWQGLGRWAIGASVWSTPMLLSGQEFGESERLAFRRSHYLPGRFEGTPSAREDADALIDAYGDAIRLRTSPEGAPLRSRGRRVLPSTPATEDALAQLKWTTEGEVWLALHNLAGGSRSATFTLPPDVAAGLGIDTCGAIRFVDVQDGGVTVPCRTLQDWARGVTVWLPAAPAWRWSQMDACTID